MKLNFRKLTLSAILILGGSMCTQAQPQKQARQQQPDQASESYNQRTAEMKKLFTQKSDGTLVYEVELNSLPYSQNEIYILAKDYMTSGQCSDTYIETVKEDFDGGVCSIRTSALLNTFRNFPRPKKKHIYWDIDVYTTYTLEVEAESGRALIRFSAKTYNQKTFITDEKRKVEKRQYSVDEYPIINCPPYHDLENYRNLSKGTLLLAVMGDAYPALHDLALKSTDKMARFIEKGALIDTNVSVEGAY